MCGSSLPLQGGERHPDNVEAVLQPTHLAGGVEVALAGLVRRADELMNLPPVIRGRR
jgi:hypothetical protein